MTRKISGAGLLPLPHSEEVQIALDDGDYLFGHSGIRTADFGGLAIDVKGGQNISPLGSYNLTCHDVIKESRNLLQRNLGVEIANKILGVGK